MALLNSVLKELQLFLLHIGAFCVIFNFSFFILELFPICSTFPSSYWSFLCYLQLFLLHIGAFCVIFNFSFFILELFVLSSTFPSSYWTCCSLQKILQVEVISLVFTAPLFHFVPQPCFSDSVSQPQELCRSGRTRCIKLHTFGLTSEDLIGEV